MRSILSTTPRIYLSGTGETHLELSGDAFRHLGRSRRLAFGEVFITFDGSGVDKRWKVLEIGENSLRAQLVEEYKHKNPPSVDLTLAFSLLKGGKSDDVIAFGTQMGVNNFIPMMCARSVAKLGGKTAQERVRRWNEICRQNAGFSLRSNVPNVQNILEFDEVLKLSDFDVKYMFYEEERESSVELPVADGLSVLALIGPEGGFEIEEVMMAKRMGFETASLGPFLLKANAAALKAVSLIIG